LTFFRVIFPFNESNLTAFGLFNLIVDLWFIILSAWKAAYLPSANPAKI